MTTKGDEPEVEQASLNVKKCSSAQRSPEQWRRRIGELASRLNFYCAERRNTRAQLRWRQLEIASDLVARGPKSSVGPE